MGRPLFQLTGAFAEFERSMIRQRALLDSSKAKIARVLAGREASRISSTKPGNCWLAARASSTSPRLVG
jgi:DNA invertase Pin-like site-specific DNA recombinase